MNQKISHFDIISARSRSQCIVGESGIKLDLVSAHVVCTTSCRVAKPVKNNLAALSPLSVFIYAAEMSDEESEVTLQDVELWKVNRLRVYLRDRAIVYSTKTKAELQALVYR
jgi:hypothetical protein